jgi:uncharacterized protein
MSHIALSQTEIENRNFIQKVYIWMSGALLTTGFVALYIAGNQTLIRFFVYNRILFFALIIGELILVGFLVSRLQKMSLENARMAFFGYAVLNGITFSSIFVIYTASSIASTFFVTAGTFFLTSLYGFTTRKDLTSLGNLAFMGLIGIILASVVNIFIGSSLITTITSYLGVLIFVGLTAYDTQKIKAMNIIGNEGTDEDTKEAIMGALTLYLDFVNLFIMLLRLFGDRRN